MWLPLVMTSTPAANSAAAVEMVSPMPPATFSPFAVTRSTPTLVAQGRQGLLDGLPAGLADDVADHQDPERAGGRARRHRGEPVGGADLLDVATRRLRSGYFAYSTARVSRMTVTLIWPG